MIDIKIDGIDAIVKRLDKIGKTIKEFEKEKNIPLNEIITDDFIKKNTGYDTFKTFISDSGLLSEEREITHDFLNSNDFNKYVKNKTDFESWTDMLHTASFEYIQKKLGF